MIIVFELPISYYYISFFIKKANNRNSVHDGSGDEEK